jgi:LAS superfamily LD-carboxypeptidase LdcB
MDKMREKRMFAIVLAIAILGFSGGGYLYYRVAGEVIKNTTDLENKVLELQDKNTTLAQNLKREQQKNGEFASQIGQIAGTVGKLDKLSKTDKELLQKYSKIYFLNENYVPEDLINIPPDYLNDKNKETKFHTKAFSYLQEMIVAAKPDGINLQIISAYRSFGEQSALKNAYAITYGSGANKFSADQGYSEHQLGTAVDFTTAESGANFTDFENPSAGKNAYRWLTQNAYKYGFVLSYPKGNTYYQFEPWHWRFVGKSLAKMLHEENKNFYDVDQRVIDNYLINIFD